ncbi:MAG: hypothetical protein AB7O26_13555 [Planctomycetaceae bacterium]
MHRAISAQSSHRIPLIIGVAGHRNLCPDDVAALKERVREVFRELRQKLPNTPLVVLSPLNEGADRLVADVALEPESGASLIAVLPWPEEICPEGRCRSGERAEFEHLLSRASDIISVPLNEDENVQPEGLSESEEQRRAQYRYVGKMIARHSQLLIALWDGREAEQSATWRVIQWQRNGVTAPYAARIGELDDAEPGPIYHIVTPRSGSTRPADALALKLLIPQSPDGEVMKKAAILNVWERIDRFNQVSTEIAHRSGEAVQRNKGYVADEAVAARLPTPLKVLLDYFALADTASQEYQNRTRRTVIWLFVLAFASVISLEVYAHFVPIRPVLLLHLLLLGAGFAWYVLAQSREIQGRYLDYRAFAEALRVQLFWRWAGLSDSAADHYLRHFRGELDWIRTAARTCFLMSGCHDGKARPATASADMLAAMHDVRIRWIEDQMNFFTKNGRRDEESERKFDKAALWSFIAAILFAVVQLMLSELNHLVILLLFASLVVAAMLEDYADYRAFAVQSRMYHWMAHLYRRANDRLRELLESGAAVTEKEMSTSQALIWELGKEALAENADWVVQHRQRPPVWKSA